MFMFSFIDESVNSDLKSRLLDTSSINNEWDAKRNSPGLPSELGHLRRYYVPYFTQEPALTLESGQVFRF